MQIHPCCSAFTINDTALLKRKQPTRFGCVLFVRVVLLEKQRVAVSVAWKRGVHAPRPPTRSLPLLREAPGGPEARGPQPSSDTGAAGALTGRAVVRGARPSRGQGNVVLGCLRGRGPSGDDGPQRTLPAPGPPTAPSAPSAPMPRCGPRQPARSASARRPGVARGGRDGAGRTDPPPSCWAGQTRPARRVKGAGCWRGRSKERRAGAGKLPSGQVVRVPDRGLVA